MNTTTGMNQKSERLFSPPREIWRKTAVTYESEMRFADPRPDVTRDSVWPENGKNDAAPCFRDGGSVSRTRSVRREENNRHYRFICSDRGNLSLHDGTETMTCITCRSLPEIYRIGFVAARHRNRYSTYDDGAPFFIPAASAGIRKKHGAFTASAFGNWFAGTRLAGTNYVRPVQKT